MEKICVFSDLELLIFTTSPPPSSPTTADTAIMYLILLTVLCGLATVPSISIAAKITPQETVHEVAHLTDVGSNNGSQDEFFYLIANDEGGAERLTNDNFDITPEGHFVDVDENKNDTESPEAHEISPGTSDLPKKVFHAVLDEIAFAVEDDPQVREIIKTSLKSGEIPIEVLTPGHKLNDKNAILIEVFHLDKEEEENSGDGLGIKEDNAAATEEPLMVTTTFPAEKSNEIKPTDIPVTNLLRLFHLVEKDIEQVEKSVEQTRKKRNSEQTAREENDKVEPLLSNKKETKRSHKTLSAAEVSSSLAADSDLAIIIPTTTKELSGFDSTTEGRKATQVFDFVTRKYAETYEEGQPTTLSPENPKASSTNESIPSININPSFVDLTDSEEDTNDDGNPDRRETRQDQVNGESSEEDFVAPTEVTDSSEESL